MNWKGMSAKVYRSLKDKAPEILSVGAIAGVVTTATLSVKCHKRAEKRMEHHFKLDAENSEPKKFTKWEYAKFTWKDYMPAIASGGLTIFAIIASNRIARSKQVALSVAYTAAQTALNEFVEKAESELGVNKVEKIRDAIAKDHVDQNKGYATIETGELESLCFDSWSGRYFAANLETVKKAQNDLNYELISGYDSFISLNRFYEMIGLGYVSNGDNLGWTLDKLLEIVLSAQLTDDGRPAIHISFKDDPHPYK